MGFFDKKPTTAAAPVTLKPLTTYLGHLVKTDGGISDYSTIPYNGKEGTIQNGRAILGRYEAVLTQAAYMSRLIYDPNLVMMGGVQFINYPPPALNTALTILNNNRDDLKTTFNKVDPTIGKAVLINDSIHDTPCYIQEVDYRNKTSACPFPGKKIVYVTFRGTNSIKTTFTDLKALPGNLNQLLEKCVMNMQKGAMDMQTGADVFKNELAAAEQYRNMASINPFGAHSGFVRNLENVMPKICSILQTQFLADGSVDQVIVTGHSLGGANASLCAMILAGFKRAGLINPSLHCITYGAPKCLMSYTRNVFNSFLLDGTMTYDRVAARMKNSLQFASQLALATGVATAPFVTPGVNIIPTIPPNFEHPGFSILNTEVKTQSTTGRSKNITDIREMFGGIKNDAGFLKSLANIGFNDLPSYKEFLDCFETLFDSEDKYKKALNNRFGTIYSDTSDFKTEYDIIVKHFKNITTVIHAKLVGEGAAAAKQKEVEEEIKKGPNASINVGNPMNEAGPKEEAGQEGGAVALDKASREYKEMTTQQGPNHIVYSCKQNISYGFCHTGYMGISFNGMLKTMLIKKPAYAEFVVSEGKIMYVDQEILGNAKTKNNYNKAKKNIENNLQKLKNTAAVVSPNNVNVEIINNNQKPPINQGPAGPASVNNINVTKKNNAVKTPLSREETNIANKQYGSQNNTQLPPLPPQGGARKHKTKKARASRPKKCKCKTQSRKHKHRRH